MRHALRLAALCLLAFASVAAAQSPYTLPEPQVGAGAVRLSAAGKCLKRPYRITVRIVPPSGVVFRTLRVRMGADEVATLQGVALASTLRLRLPSRRARVTVRGITAGGQAVSAGRTYSRCAVKRKKKKQSTTTPTKPKPVIQTPNIEGGGED